MRKLVAYLICLLALTGCIGPTLHHASLVALDQGMTPETVARRVGLEPLAVYRSTIEGKAYALHRYIFNNGASYYAPYFLGYEDGQLRYWGYIDEFRRHPDKRLAQAADSAWTQFLAERKAAAAAAAAAQ